MKKRLHRVVVTMMFDEPCTAGAALQAAREFVVADYASSHDDNNGFTITSATWLSKVGARDHDARD